MEYTKPPITIDQQLDILKTRGMIVDDSDNAREYLHCVNYYRFCGYALYSEIFSNGVRTHQYKEGTTFNSIINLYEFDDKLRAILFDYIGHIEVAFRSIFCLEASLFYADSHWHLKKHHFNSRFDFHGFLSGCHNETKRSREIFVKSYYKKYHEPALPAIWMMTEILSFGRWSKMYASITESQVKKKVADKFRVKPDYLESWIKGITELRNQCAHHSSVWNKQFVTPLKIFQSKRTLVPENRKLAAYIFVLTELLSPLQRKGKFLENLTDLFIDYIDIPRDVMGFTPELLEELRLE
jgi:abortive infection bacteriophage resistance protein